VWRGGKKVVARKGMGGRDMDEKSIPLYFGILILLLLLVVFLTSHSLFSHLIASIMEVVIL